MKPARLEALSDGIFAIVMTLLVLDIKVPTVAVGAFQNFNLWFNFTDLGPKFLAYFVSFGILAVYLVGHHVLFSYVHRLQFAFIWWTMAFLAFIGLIPFSTAFLSSNFLGQLPQVVYALNLVISGLLLFVLWRYLENNEHIMEPGKTISSEARRNARGKVLIPPFCYILAIIISFFNSHISLWFLVAGPIVYFIPIDHPLWLKLTRGIQDRPAIEHRLDHED